MILNLRENNSRNNLMTDPSSNLARSIHRRTFLSRSAMGLGAVGLGGLLDPQLFAATAENTVAHGVIDPPHHEAKAKRVIWLTMAGGPSHLETWDYKPKLAEMHGQPMPESFTKGQQLAQLQGQKLVCYGPQTKFKKFGGTEIRIRSIFLLQQISLSPRQ